MTEQQKSTSFEGTRVLFPVILIAAPVGITADLLGVRLNDAALLVLIVCVILYFFRRELYHLFSFKTERVHDRGTTVFWNLFSGLGYLSLAAAAAVFVAFVSPRLQATVLNRRLDEVLRAPVTQVRNDDAHKLVQTAVENKVRVRPALLSKTFTSDPTLTDDQWAAVVDATNQQLMPNWDPHSPGNLVEMQVGNTKLSYVTFDGFVFIYDGAPLVLDGVTFKHCQLRVANNPNGHALLRAILAADGKPVTISLGKS